jgi:hypothetical protein
MTVPDEPAPAAWREIGELLADEADGMFDRLGRLERAQFDVARGLARLDRRLGRVQTRFGYVEQRMATDELRMGTVEHRMGGLERAFERLAERVDAQFEQLVALVGRNNPTES